MSQASLVMIPSGYKEDVVYSQIPTNGNGDLSFTRASNGTRVNSAGLVEVCPWNLLSNSEQFTTANGWFPNFIGSSTASQTSDYGVAPNGTTTADRIQLALNGEAYADWVIVPTLPIIIGQIYTYSIYIKSLSGTKTIAFFNDGGAGDILTTVTTEWERLTYTWTASSTSVYPRFLLLATTSSSADLLAWGAQINIGSTAKPYFPTTDRLNVPRLTYQNGGGGCPSLLLEKQSTNLLTYSEQFDNTSGWSTAGSTVTANNTTSPDGTQNADLLTLNVTAYPSIYQAVTTTNGAIYTASIYAKKGNQNFLGLEIRGSSSVTDTVFNLNTGVVVSGTGTIESVGNGWYRCSITKAANSTSTLLIIGRGDTATSGDTLYLWGAQLEQSSYQTSYIVSTSSSATRVADACFKTGISSLIGQTEGVVFADFYWNGNAVENWLGSVQTSTTNFVAIFLLDDGRPYYYILNSGSAQMAYIGTALSIGRHKMAIGYKQNDSVAYMDGNLLNADTSCTIPATSEYRVGGISSTSGQEARINQAVLFPTRLTNAELASLTTI